MRFLIASLVAVLIQTLPSFGLGVNLGGALNGGGDYFGADADGEGSIGAGLGGDLDSALTAGGLLRNGPNSRWGDGRDGDSVHHKEGVQNSINVRANKNSGTININLKSQGRGGVIGNRNAQSGNVGAQGPQRRPVYGYGGGYEDVDAAGGDLYGGLDLGAGLRGSRLTGGRTWAVEPVAEPSTRQPANADESTTTKADASIKTARSAPAETQAGNFLDNDDGDTTDARIQLQGGARLSDGTRVTRLPRNTRNVLINPIYVQSQPHIDANTAVHVRNHVNSHGGGHHSGRRWREDDDDGSSGDYRNGDDVDGNDGGGRLHGNGGGGLSGGLGGVLGGGGGAGKLLAPVSGVLDTVGSGLLRGGGDGGLVGNLGNGLLGGPGGGLLGPGGGVRGLLGGDTPTRGGSSDGGARRSRRSRRRRGDAPKDKGVVGTLLNDLLKGTT